MFNKTVVVPVIHETTRHIETTKHIHEHRAPTDDSIRLAKEYEEKAWASVVGKTVEKLPSIDAEFIAIEREHYDRALHVLCKINGQTVQIKHGDERDKTEMYRGIAKALVERIMTQLFMVTK